jgi:hypothetical protein
MFLAERNEGRCIYTDLPTHFKHRGEWTSEHFLLAGRKLWVRFKDTEPDFTVEKAIDVIISAQSYRVVYGEDKMDKKHLKGGLWNKLKSLL